VEPHADTAWGKLNLESSTLPHAQWYGPVMQQMVSYVKVIIPGQPITDRTYVFVRADDPVKVNSITQAEYLAIAGPVNFTP
jgi:hypothetical protein